MNLTQRIKGLTGRIMAAAIGLHVKAIHGHVKSHERRCDALALQTDQAETDLGLARAAFEAAIDAENSSRIELSAAQRSAVAELAALPAVNGYGNLRTPPPFGASPVVIDKRSF